MFAVAPYSPASTPPLPPFDITPPPLPEPASPPFHSSPSPSMSPTPPSPPVIPPVSSSPSPETLLVPDSPLPPSSVVPLPLTLPLFPSPSPATLPPPFPPLAVTASPPTPTAASQPPPFPFAAAPATITFPPFEVTASPPTPTETETIPPPSVPTAFTEPTLAPEVTSASTSSNGNLPVAVEVQKVSRLHVPSGLTVGLVVGAIVLVFVFAVGSVLCRNRKKNKHKNLPTHHCNKSSPYVGSNGSHVIGVPSNPTLPPHLTKGGGASGSFNSVSVKAISNHTPRGAFGPVNGILTYDELLVATNYFSESNLLGEGGFGYVYKGVLPCGKEIAVKQLKTGSQQGEREFQAEVETISRVHHKHLVQLVGYCVTGAERLLVYEFVPNHTLEFHLHGNPAIIHRDIKASNILLDFKFEPKVSDFGLAKIFPNTDSCISHLTTRVMGTFGYLAPEYASSGKVTDKSDVYSYGVMLLELITGRPPITATGSRNESLVDWARPLLAQALQDGDFDNLVDPRLQKNYEDDEMVRMITCAAACVRHSARLRPRMSQIVGALEGVVSLTDLVGDITPGHTTIYNWSNSSNYDANQYQQDIRNFNLALSCQKYSSSRYSETTSAYDLHSSSSSGEAQESIQDMMWNVL
ncbi:Proline-rich receptor-like protein kinase PERK5, partial [Mucuna pruriens]